MKELITELIKKIQSEQEPVNGSEWQSGYNNGLARADELLCELNRKVSAIESKRNQGCRYCNDESFQQFGSHVDTEGSIMGINHFCINCGRKF